MAHTAEGYLRKNRGSCVHQNGQDDLPVFEYDRQFLRSGNVLSPFRMPLSDSAYSFPAVDRLCLTGPRGTGALEYVPEAAPAFSHSSATVTETAAVISDWMRCAEKSGITEARAAEIAEGIRAANA